MSTGQKHLVKCRCILQQYKNVVNPPFHMFVVFSIINDDDVVQVKFVQCNNCGVVHKVYDINKSKIMVGKEHLSSVRTIDEIKPSISEKLCAILETNDVDVATWEAVEFIIENEKWGEFVALTQDTDGDLKQGKLLVILGKHDLFKVESFVESDFVEE